MTKKLDQQILGNGMVVLGEPMSQVDSVAFSFYLPGGSASLPQGCCGAGNVLTDWLLRGAGQMNSKQLIDALDGLGLQRHISVTTHHLVFSAALEASNLLEALSLYADIILRPKLDFQQYELSKQLAIHEVIGLDDDPRQNVMLKLYEQFYPKPLGLPSIGKLDELEKLTADKCAELADKQLNPAAGIFSVAGKYDFDAVCKKIEELFGNQDPKEVIEISPGDCGALYSHNQHEGAQVHIGLMTETVPITSEGYYNAMAAASVLSGGMSSRLFTEVREKRGLCYAVGARYNTLKDYAGICCYAGTTPDKAQETHDVIISEFNRLHEGITEDEIERAKVGLKSTLIMQSESSSTRATGIASDYFLLGRVRSLEEIKEKLEMLSVDSVVDFLNKNRFKDFTIVTIGPNAIEH